MKKHKVIKVMSGLSILIILAISLFFYEKHLNERLVRETNAYLKSLYLIERSVIENIPVFDDFTSPSKEKKLRTYLLKYHQRAARKYGAGPAKDSSHTLELLREGKLTELESDPENPYYFYNVRKEHRYLTPMAAEGLMRTALRFQEKLRERGAIASAKLAVSSALRPLDYQEGLLSRNFNATLESTHSYGTSFDIFFDDYYVVLPEPESDSVTGRAIQENVRRRFGFLMGDALRRQFHPVLMETLIELQNEGLLYAILERKQRCYHVTVLKEE